MPPRCASLRRTSGTPSKRFRSSSRPGPETMSPSERSAMTACVRRLPSSDWMSEKAALWVRPIGRDVILRLVGESPLRYFDAAPRVRILIGGQEVDTLAGHVDLRRPLRRNEGLINEKPPE